MSNKKIKIVVVIGSISENSFTRKSVKLAINEIEKNEHISVDIIDPRNFDLPLPGLGIQNESKERLQKIIREADGAILATPEYNGSFSSIMKIVIENLSYPSELSGKPIALIGIASGDMGAIKSIEALRGVCAHIGGIVLPNSTSVSHINEKFNSDDNCIDEQTERRIRRVGTNLVKYIKGYGS